MDTFYSQWETICIFVMAGNDKQRGEGPVRAPTEEDKQRGEGPVRAPTEEDKQRWDRRNREGWVQAYVIVADTKN
jgi:hypothetical protein